jgi:IS5 family transposase
MFENNFYKVLFGVPDTNLAKLIKFSCKTGSLCSEIYKRIDADLDKKGLKKKKIRIQYKMYIARQTGLLSEEFSDPDNIDCTVTELETGRTRISAEEVFIFICLRGYFDSVTSEEASERMVESVSLQIYYFEKNKRMPRPKTINESLNAVSSETMEFIHKYQLEQFLNEGLDDFSYAVFDSTSVHASSSWPTDAAVIYRLFIRIRNQALKFDRFDLKNISSKYPDKWLNKLSKLLFKINNTKGTAGNPKKEKVKPDYKQYLRIAHKMNEFYIKHLATKCNGIKRAELQPSEMAKLLYLYENLKDDRLAVSAVLYYTEERVFFEKKLPSSEKILSLSDTTAAFIKKGNRNSVIGYKPQLGMSKNGYVSALIIEPGNGADSVYFVPLVKKHIDNTGITPDLVSADDGYSSAAGRKEVLGLGVKDVSFSGAVGRKILGEELWKDEKYTEARRNRSAVEALMFSLKYTVHFGRLRRRGIEAVKCEMLGKVIAYNYLHKIVRIENIERIAA